MANREKGEASVEIGGKTYTMSVDMHAWALAQDALTKGNQVPDLNLLSKRLTAGHMLSIIAVFWASLQRHHAREFQTLRQASILLDRSEGAAAAALVRAVNDAGPDKADLRELGVGKADPPAAVPPTADGTGVRPI